MMTGNEYLQHYLVKAYQYVIARCDVDGFRIDTLRHLKNNLTQLFGNSVREYARGMGKKIFISFGETLDQDPEAEFISLIG
jgi:glycosidase